jgi:DNA-binding transcriptional ArsR family regulator
VRLFFVPVTQRTGWVSWDDDAERYAVVYPCSGALADTGRSWVPDSLGRLLGPARATVLVLLADPKSTTQLVALTGQGLGSVGRHLKVLLDSGLAGRRRTGRSVLYFRTDMGDVLVEAQRERESERSRRPERA